MNSKYILTLIFAILAFSAETTIAQQNDFKIRQRMTMSGQSFDSTVMIKGARQRSESNMAGMQNVSVMQCDLKRTIDISELEKKYVVTPMETALPSEGPPRAVSTTRNNRQPVEKGGVITQTIEMIDTGERKQMFGMTARHIKTIMTMEPSPDACQKTSQRIETDGWYVDLTFGLSCQIDRPQVPPMPMADGGGGCRDRINVVQKGKAKLGYPLLQTTTIAMGGSDGEAARMSSTMTIEVLELSKAALEPALFDIPAGYTEAASRNELYGAASQRAMAEQYSKRAQDENNAPARRPENSNARSSNAKRPGVIRIGVLPVTNSTTRDLSLDMYRSRLVSSLFGGNVEAVPLNSEADAGRLECDYILSTSVKSMKQSAASKAGGLFGKVTGASTAGLAKVESTVAYTLRPISGVPVLISESSAKVEGDDNSVMASLGTEAQAVLKAVNK